MVDIAWRCYSSPTSMAAFEILRATRGRLGDSSRRRLLDMNAAIRQLGRLISAEPAHHDVAEVIWSALRGMVMVQMIMGTPLDWQRERLLLIDMVTQYLERNPPADPPPKRPAGPGDPARPRSRR
jgi:hypothetical protein